MKHKVSIHRTEEGICVSVPSLPGCWSEGDTEEEALANIEDAIREYLAVAAARSSATFGGRGLRGPDAKKTAQQS
jgi:predicted RNase H-like HicB family nuclease